LNNYPKGKFKKRKNINNLKLDKWRFWWER